MSSSLAPWILGAFIKNLCLWMQKTLFKQMVLICMEAEWSQKFPDQRKLYSLPCPEETLSLLNLGPTAGSRGCRCLNRPQQPSSQMKSLWFSFTFREIWSIYPSLRSKKFDNCFGYFYYLNFSNVWFLTGAWIVRIAWETHTSWY